MRCLRLCPEVCLCGLLHLHADSGASPGCSLPALPELSSQQLTSTSSAAPGPHSASTKVWAWGRTAAERALPACIPSGTQQLTTLCCLPRQEPPLTLTKAEPCWPEENRETGPKPSGAAASLMPHLFMAAIPRCSPGEPLPSKHLMAAPSPTLSCPGSSAAFCQQGTEPRQLHQQEPPHFLGLSANFFPLKLQHSPPQTPRSSLTTFCPTSSSSAATCQAPCPALLPKCQAHSTGLLPTLPCSLLGLPPCLPSSRQHLSGSAGEEGFQTAPKLKAAKLTA